MRKSFRSRGKGEGMEVMVRGDARRFRGFWFSDIFSLSVVSLCIYVEFGGYYIYIGDYLYSGYLRLF